MATPQEVANAKASAARERAEADLGGAESVSETIGQIFAGYQCGTLQVRVTPSPSPVSRKRDRSPRLWVPSYDTKM